MKKFCISILVFAIIFLSAIGLDLSQPKTQVEYLRIHIRANSNLEVDQAVKYKVKDAVVKYLTPFIVQCDSKIKAQKMLENCLDGVRAVADKTLKENGFSYAATASIKREEFPTRIYGELQLEKGFYDALIVGLGDAAGDNWWCVIYPPLCFTGGENGYVYKSKIKEIIDDFFNKENYI